MPTADSVKAKLQELIDKANSATGESDTTLTEAVNRLVSGYGSGGGTESVTSGSFTLTEQTLAYTVDIGRECENFVFLCDDISLDTGFRTFCGGFLIDGFSVPFAITTNAAGTTVVGSLNSDTVITISGDTVALTGSSSTYPGYLAPKTYSWRAW